MYLNMYLNMYYNMYYNTYISHLGSWLQEIKLQLQLHRSPPGNKRSRILQKIANFEANNNRDVKRQGVKASYRNIRATEHR